MLRDDCCGNISYNDFDSYLNATFNISGLDYYQFENATQHLNNIMSQAYEDNFYIVSEDFNITLKVINDYAVSDGFINRSHFVFDFVIDCYEIHEKNICTRIKNIGILDTIRAQLRQFYGDNNIDIKASYSNIECRESHCGLISPNQDILTNPAIAYWNSTLYVFGSKYVYHTTFDITKTNNQYNWSYHQHPSSLSDLSTSIHMRGGNQGYFQHKSSFWLLAADKVGTGVDGQHYLVHLNLETLEETYDEAPSISESSTCLVSDSNYLYLIDHNTVSKYNIGSGQWEIDEHEIQYSFIDIACAITNDNQYIYIFQVLLGDRDILYSDSVNITGYNIQSDVGVTWNTDILYSVRSLIAITASNGLIYLYNICADGLGRTLIFNTKKKTFESKRIDIDYNMDLAPQFAGYSDNVLLFWITSNAIFIDFGFNTYDVVPGLSSLYTFVTNERAINFTKTTSTIWPSDGFKILFNIADDFSDLKDDDPLYNITFYCNDIIDINANLTVYINAKTADCIKICDEISNECFDCNEGNKFPLESYLTATHNDINLLNFYISSHPQNIIEILTIPQYIIITLKRCHIKFVNTNPNYKIDEEYPTITFNYTLSDECYNEKTSFSLNIETFYYASSETLTANNMIINIMEDGKNIFTICAIGNNSDTYI